MSRATEDTRPDDDILLVPTADGDVVIADVALSVLRDEVVAVCRRCFPDWPFEATDDGLSCGELHLNLGNLYTFLQVAAPDDRADAIAEWLGLLLAPDARRRNEAVDAAIRTWTGAKPLLRPRLTHRSATDYPPGLITEDFCGDLVIFYAIDCGSSDRWLTADLMAPWNVSLAQLRDAATENLQGLTAALTFQLTTVAGGSGRYLFIASGDGYDASRILLPNIRKMLLTELDEPVFVGLPAKDVMICWSADMDDHAAMVRIVRSAVETWPYPISSDIYVLDADGLEVVRDLVAPDAVPSSYL